MGIDYTKRPKNQPPQQSPTPPPSAPPAHDRQPPTQPVSLSKITLTKSTPSVSLTKQGATSGQVRVNLDWTSNSKGGGLFRKARGIDLDLACLWEFTDGSKGIVQALGRSFQAPSQGKPIIYLDGDDRSGSGGENMYIDLSATDRIRRVLIFAYIYEGTPNWASANGVVTLYPASGPEIEVRLDEADQSAISCAIALLENRGGELVVNREVRYIRGAQDKVDEAYGWGMNWRAGRK
ncbi:TerD family protein [Gordonia aurantiaca]|uniref:TerD family protein n=1 Tax=Gordonia sp. B21 TaxID=3151852 RepID=UPI003264024C